ncbi:MAG: hypothetical protein U0Q55_16650 [Vicinamibacterales bacterium]
MHLHRELGRPVRWRFLVAARSESMSGTAPAQVRAALLAGPCQVSAQWTGAGGGELAPAALVTGARRVTQGLIEYLEIEAESTSVGNPDPFVPRRRVHKVQNLADLLDRFAHVAQPVKALKPQLEGVRFVDGAHHSIVQDGMSDWQFVHHVMEQAELITGRAPSWLPLVVVGSVDEAQGTDGKWIITPGSRKAYEEWGAVSSRLVEFDDSPDRDGEQRFDFGMARGHRPVPAYPHGTYPVAVEWRPRRAFDSGRWGVWRKQDLPRFTTPERAMVWKIEDRLYSKGDEALAWETWVHAGPPQMENAPPLPVDRYPTWNSLGLVEESTRMGPWIKVKLAGFESGSDVLEVRLGTLYSGKTGKRGFHLPPEVKTEVLLGWNGRFDQSIVSLANVRSQETDIKSLSLYLESKYRIRTSEVWAKTGGQLTVIVDDLLEVQVEEKTNVTSGKPLQIKADGAEIRMKNGTVYTGKGL